MPLLPQFGFFELITIAVIALVVVGPKDLPALMRSAGRMAAQARRLASEFTAAFDQMAREAEMDEMRKEIDALKNDNVFAEAKKSIEDAVTPVSDALRNEAGDVRDAINKPVGSSPPVAQQPDAHLAPSPEPAHAPAQTPTSDTAESAARSHEPAATTAPDTSPARAGREH